MYIYMYILKKSFDLAARRSSVSSSRIRIFFSRSVSILSLLLSSLPSSSLSTLPSSPQPPLRGLSNRVSFSSNSLLKIIFKHKKHFLHFSSAYLIHAWKSFEIYIYRTMLCYSRCTLVLSITKGP